MNKLLEELIKEEKILLLRLQQINKLKVLYLEDTAGITDNTGTTANVLNALSIIEDADVKKLSEYLNKSTKTIDNILRSLVKENKVEVTKEGKKNIFKIKNHD